MFEQTLLTHPASARKTGALAASFVAQTAIVGVLVVGPLLYTQALPMVPVFLGVLSAPPLPQPPPVARPEVTTTTASTRGMARMFVPTHIPTGPIRASVPDIVFEPVSDTFAPGIPGVEGIPGPTIATLAPAPRVDLVKPAATVTPAVVADPKPLIVSSTILAAKIIKRVVPSYPLLAKQARVSGTVRLQATLSKDGRIENLRVIDGPPLLRQAALDAVRQWIYSPTILNGKPVEVEAPIEVNFTLN